MNNLLVQKKESLKVTEVDEEGDNKNTKWAIMQQ